jgi:hypothetical protein
LPSKMVRELVRASGTPHRTRRAVR